MKHFAILLGLSFLIALPSLAQEPTAASIEAELDAAKSRFDDEIKSAKQQLQQQLNEKLDFATRRGSLELVETVSEQLKIFVADGTLPTIVSTSSFDRVVNASLSRLEKAFENAIRFYVQQGMLDDARFLREEYAAIRDSATGSLSMPVAEIEIVSGSARFQPLSNGARAFTNRRYVWGDIADDFPLKRFSAVEGGGTKTIHVKLKTTGLVYVAFSTEDQVPVAQFAKINKWAPTELTFSFNAKARRKMFVLQKVLRPGEYRFPRIGWSGPVFLLP